VGKQVETGFSVSAVFSSAPETAPLLRRVAQAGCVFAPKEAGRWHELPLSSGSPPSQAAGLLTMAVPSAGGRAEVNPGGAWSQGDPGRYRGGIGLPGDLPFYGEPVYVWGGEGVVPSFAARLDIPHDLSRQPSEFHAAFRFDARVTAGADLAVVWPQTSPPFFATDHFLVEVFVESAAVVCLTPASGLSLRVPGALVDQLRPLAAPVPIPSPPPADAGAGTDRGRQAWVHIIPMGRCTVEHAGWETTIWWNDDAHTGGGSLVLEEP